MKASSKYNSECALCVSSGLILNSYILLVTLKTRKGPPHAAITTDPLSFVWMDEFEKKKISTNWIEAKQNSN